MQNNRQLTWLPVVIDCLTLERARNGELLTWDQAEPRSGQWDMGHKSGREYRKLHKDYVDGVIDKNEFLRIYHDPENYVPEAPSSNRSRKYEEN